MAAFFAIFSAFLYALSNVIAKRGFQYASPLAATLVSLLACFFFSLILCLFRFSPEYFFNKATLFFLIAGVIGPFWGRLCLYEAIDRVGASISLTLFETKPLFSVVAAVFFLNEQVTALIITGVLLMMIGTAIISIDTSGGEIRKKWSKKDLIFPFLAGAFYGGSHVLRKIGINIIPVPIAAVMFQNAGALAFAPLLLIVFQNGQRLFANRLKALFIFSIASLLNVFAQWCLFTALDYGTVVVVSPLTSLSTLFVLLLATLFLRKLEKVTPKIFLGAALIVGATLILSASI